MELKTYIIRYSIIVDGNEYPNSTEIQAIDKEEAKQKLRDLIKNDYETSLQIKEVI